MGDQKKLFCIGWVAPPPIFKRLPYSGEGGGYFIRYNFRVNYGGEKKTFGVATTAG